MSRGSLILALTLVLAACGGTAEEADIAQSETPSQAEATPQPETTTTTEASSNDESSGGGGAADLLLVPAGNSTVSVDGQAMTTQDLLRCISSSESDGNLDLTVLGDGFTLFIYYETSDLGERHRLSISGPAVASEIGFEGTVSQMGDSWIDDSLEPVDGPAFDWQGDRISGSLTLIDALEEADPIEVVFDVIVPGDINDCSL